MTDHASRSFYFPRPAPFPQLFYVGYVGIIFSVVQFFSGNAPQAGTVLLISAVILLLRSWSKFNPRTGNLIDFFTIIPYRNQRIASIQKVILTKGRVSQTMSLRANTSTVSFTQYKIILVNSEENIVLQVGKHADRLRKKAQSLADSIHAPFQDLTE